MADEPTGISDAEMGGDLGDLSQSLEPDYADGLPETLGEELPGGIEDDFGDKVVSNTSGLFG